MTPRVPQPGDQIAGIAPDRMLDGAPAAAALAAWPAPRRRLDLHGLLHASYWDLPGATLAPPGRTPEVIALPGPVPPRAQERAAG